MNFVCKFCPKSYKTEKALKLHIQKAVPCNLVCRICNFNAGNRNKYDYHVRTRHTKAEDVTPGNNTKEEDVTLENNTAEKDVTPVTSELAVMPKATYIPGRARVRLPGDPPREEKPLIPLDDFNLEMLRELMQLANRENMDITIVHLHPRNKEQVTKAMQCFQYSDYAQSLHCLDQPVNEVASKVLSNFHSDPKRPQLHTIRMTDYSRKIVQVYSRPDPEQEIITWLPFAKQPTLDRLSHHASTLTTFAIENGIDKLQYKLCVREQSVCFCLPDENEKNHLIIVDSNDFDNDDDDILRSLGYGPKLKVMFYDGELCEIVQGFGFTEKARQLGELIQQKSDEVFKQLKELSFTEDDIYNFLERTRRPFCAK